ncbi:hypothetical protein PV328_007628 [Microctonus aethiopoides]|uniref:Exonuclease domain-containing protein n=1 Tax=Microctonus aethiopoides TaxID=144406 RepID=A0AA39F0Q1_9HYME|nr:hypothetical protein PV328_007628 [Microctonus aethiopoides]
MGLLEPSESNKDNLETGGFQMSCDLLQIAMKHIDTKFNEYITPRQSIRPQVTNINGLSNVGKQLYYRGNLVSSSALDLVFQRLVTFFKNCNKRCILVAHNCAFDAPRLIKAIRNQSLVDKFSEVILGFVDTLPMFRKKFPERKGKEQCTLISLVEKILDLPTKKAHDANYDVYLLVNLTQHHFTLEDIAMNQKPFNEFISAQLSQEKSREMFLTLDPLKGNITNTIRKQMADADMNYNSLSNKLSQEGPKKTVQFLKQTVNEKATVIKPKKIIEVISKHLSSIVEHNN